MTDDAPVVFKVPDDVAEKLRKQLREPADDHPDTDAACAIFVQLYLKCADMARVELIPMNADAAIESSSIASLTIKGLPLISQVACDRMRQARCDDTIYDIRCIFADPLTLKPHDRGWVEIEFWRSTVPPSERRENGYTPPEVQFELTATPLWDSDDLRIGGDEFATDRQRLLAIMKLVRNMHSDMPIGIQTSLDLIYADDFFTTSKGKRKRGADADDRAGGKRNTRSASDGLKSQHIGYCINFQHRISLPTINAAFMRYVCDKIGSTVMNWLVLFPHTKKIPNSSTHVDRRDEVLSIILRRADRPDEQVVPFTVSGTQWLVRQIEKTDW